MGDKKKIILEFALYILILLLLISVSFIMYFSSKQKMELEDIKDKQAAAVLNLNLTITNETNDSSMSESNIGKQAIIPQQPVPQAVWSATSLFDSGLEDDVPTKLLMDAQGNVYVVGSTESDLKFGYGGKNTNNGDLDFFVVRYNKKGEANLVLWPKEGIGDNLVKDIVVKDSDIYLTGYTESDIDLGEDYDLENQGKADFFVAKYTHEGKADLLISSEGNSGNEDDYSNQLFIDDNDDIFIIGETKSDLRFGNRINTKTPGSGTDFFLAKYDSEGEAQFVISYTSEDGNLNDHISDYYIDNDGNIFILGYAKSDIDFGDGNKLSNQGGFDFFVAKFDPDGNINWIKTTKSYTGLNDDITTKMIGDDTGIYIAGYTKSNLDFGKDTEGKDYYLKNKGGIDFFIVKYTTDGDIKWLISPELGPGDDMIVDMTISTSDMVNETYLYLTGYTESDLNLGDLNLQSKGRTDFFIAKFNNTDGTPVWVKTAQDNAKHDDKPVKILVQDDHIYLAGNSEGNIGFGNNVVYENQDNSDFFVVKYTDAGVPLWVLSSMPSQRQGEVYRKDIYIEKSGERDDYIIDMLIDKDGNDNIIYLLGQTEGNLDFGNKLFVDNNGGIDFWLVKYEE